MSLRDSLIRDLETAERECGSIGRVLYLRAEIRALTPDPPPPVMPRIPKRVVGLRGPFAPPVKWGSDL